MKRKNMCAVPPMGWNSWNTFAENINEELIFGIVDQMWECMESVEPIILLQYRRISDTFCIVGNDEFTVNDRM